MRGAFLLLIVLCEIVIALTRRINVDTFSLSLVTTLMVVVIMAFMISAPLHKIKSMSLARNYMVSGIIGVIIGILYFTWVRDHLTSMLLWLKNYGLFILLLIIFISALVLYFKGPKSSRNTKTADVAAETNLPPSQQEINVSE